MSGDRDDIVRRSMFKPSTRGLPLAKGMKNKGQRPKHARLWHEQAQNTKLPPAKTRVKLELKDNPALDYKTRSDSTAPDHLLLEAANSHRQLYVCTFVKPLTGFMNSFSTILIRKPPGSLHAGLLNLPGGKVEKGEKPHHAAIRELFEETGISGSFPTYLGAIRDVNKKWDVLVYSVIRDPDNAKLPTRYIHLDTANPTQKHEVLTVDICDPSYRDQMVPNLPLLLSLCATNLRGWSLQEQAWFPGLTHESYAGVLNFHPRPAVAQDRPRTPKSDVGIAR